MDILIILVWCIIGSFSFWYWWTKDYDLTIGIIPLWIFSMWLGPFSFIVGFLIHSDYSRKIILKKRG